MVIFHYIKPCRIIFSSIIKLIAEKEPSKGAPIVQICVF